jgi:hypothetical protein
MATCAKHRSPKLQQRNGAPVSAWFVLLALLLIAGGSSPAASASKKLIEFGWDEPNTSFLRLHQQEMARSPFDGCVFHADYKRANGTEGSFTWQAWSQTNFSETDLSGAFTDLKAMRGSQFRHNFLRFNTTPANLDWFDDFSAVLANAALAAQLARAGHCPGILFDIEQYEAPLFNYRKQRDAENKSWELYASQVRFRGSQLMQSFQRGYPNLTVFLTFGYSLPWSETAHGRKALADCKYGLLAPLLDGMTQAAKGKSRLVDGFEVSYGYKKSEQFAAARKMFQQELVPITAEAARYRNFFSLAFGIWLDRDWRTRGWDPGDTSKNYFSPEDFGAAVGSAFDAADEYVWIYSESPRWWGSNDPKTAIPTPYIEALRHGRQ